MLSIVHLQLKYSSILNNHSTLLCMIIQETWGYKNKWKKPWEQRSKATLLVFIVGCVTVADCYVQLWHAGIVFLVCYCCRYFPPMFKEHTSHDVLLMCPPCHKRSSEFDSMLKFQLVQECNAPLESGRNSHISQDRDLQEVRSAAR